jgi:hypothetical protein
MSYLLFSYSLAMSKLNVQVLPPSTTLFSTKDYRTYMIIIERQNKRDAVSNIDIHSIYIYIYVWIQKLIVNFISLALKKKKESNDFTFALICFEHSAFFSLWSLHCMQADDTLQILPFYMCARSVTYISRMIKQKLPLDLLSFDFV